MWNVPPPLNLWASIESFLTVRAPTGRAWVSNFSAVVRDARQATGRDMDSGAVQNETAAGSWLGTLGYMVMLDQVGECFRPATLPRTPAHPASMTKALTYFAPSLSDDEILALYALRNSFAHDYNLVNVPRKPGKYAGRLTHNFLLTDSATGPLLRFPATPWNGDLRLVTLSRTRTLVNVRALGDLAESLVTNVRETHRARQLEIALPGGIDELFACYVVSIWSDET